MPGLLLSRQSAAAEQYRRENRENISESAKWRALNNLRRLMGLEPLPLPIGGLQKIAPPWEVTVGGSNRPKQSQVPLTPETAIPGRIVFITEFKKDSSVPRSSNVRKEAEGHPAVILCLGSALHGLDKVVQVLPITSWNGSTKEQKWDRGKGVEFRDQYLMIDHAKTPSENPAEVLFLGDGKQMRTRSYVSIREDTYIVGHQGLVLYTDASREDLGFFLDDDSLRRLRKAYIAYLFERLNQVVAPEKLSSLSV